MNIKNDIFNVSKHGNKHDLIHFVTTLTMSAQLFEENDWRKMLRF